MLSNKIDNNIKNNNNKIFNHTIGILKNKNHLSNNNNNHIIADSGCTHILISNNDSHLITPNNSIQPLTQPISQPDGSKLYATSSGTAQLTNTLTVPAHLVPGLQHSLGGLAPIIDAGCTVLFGASSVSVFRDNILISSGKRVGNLWHLPVLTPSFSSPTTTPATTPDAKLTWMLVLDGNCAGVLPMRS